MSTARARIGLSRKARNTFARIEKEFPNGYLPEELESATTGTNSLKWPWKDASADSLASSLGPAGDAELLGLEAAIAEALAAGKLNDVMAEMSASLTLWAQEQLTADGHYRGNPWLTFALVPPLYRLRIALADGAWTAPLEESFQKILQATHRTAWWRGWLFGYQASPSTEFRRMLDAAISGQGTRRWNLVRKMLWEKEKNAKRNPDEECGFQSDETKTCVLRKDWTVGAPVLGVDFRSPTVKLQGRLFGEPVFAGPWKTGITINGESIATDGDWDATCWFADSDGEYLELQQTLDHDVVVARQAFLARRVAMLWISDTVCTPKPADIHLTWQLPTREGIELKGELPTRAQRIRGHRFELRFLPIGQPAEPLQSATGRFGMSEDGLQIEASATGVERLFLPAAFTWSARSLPAPTAWRSLAITNDRRRIAPDEAVAFRIPVADTQLIFFRALKKPLRYAFVGHQTYSECEIGEIDRKGNFKEWLTIEEDSTT